MFAEALEAILKDHCTPAVVRSIEDGASGQDLWERVESAGFLDLLTPETEGGGGLSLHEFYPVLLAIGRHALPLPLAQSMAVRALASEGSKLPTGLISIAPGVTEADDGSLICPLVPHGLQASHVVLAHKGRRRLLETRNAERKAYGAPGRHTATLCWSQGHATGVDLGPDSGELEAWGAAIHAALIASAMARIFEMTLDHCNGREQFGRPLGKYQAVQHQLSVMAQQVVASSSAAQAAFQGEGSSPSLMSAAAAKSRASEAAVSVANTGHALHGAIGVTAEYDLQLYTRRLHEWRLAHGSEAWWNLKLGHAVLSSTQGLTQFVQALQE
jgi:alkylation response protein AidB-like acyl-CoA dehydrogenase